MKSRLGLRLWLASTLILLLSLGLFAAIGIRLLVQFGEETARNNEESILKSAEGFLARSAHEQAHWCDEMFRRIANGAVSIAGKASRIYATFDAADPTGETPAIDLSVCEKNGIFTNPASSETMALYWGGPRISPVIQQEMAALTGLDEVLTDVLAQNPETIAAFFVSQSGMARYQPNVHNVESIPEGFDIRKANWYQKATPDQNPQKIVAWSNVYSDILGRGLMITAAMPAYDGSGRFVGAAGVDLTLESLLKQLGVEIPSPHKIPGMFVFLLDGEGRIIAFPPDKLGLFGIGMDTRDLTDSSRILSQTLQSSKVPAVQRLGTQILTEPYGVFPIAIGDADLLIASHFLALTGWKLNLAIPRDLILESVIRGRQQLNATVVHIKWIFLLVSAGFVLLSLTVGTLLFLKYLVVPLQELEKAAARVRSGDFDAVIPVLRKDEIGSLAASFNEMMEGLRRGRELEQNYARQLREEIQKKTQEIEKRKETLEQTLKTLEQEIGERKEMEAALRRSESEKSLILNSTTEMFAYYDLDLRVRWANKASGDSLGQPVEALVGNHCYELWHNRSEPCEDCPVLLAASTGVPQQSEMTSPDGRVWRVRGYPVRDEKGDLMALIEFTQEITAQRRAEAEKAVLEVRTRQLVKAESLGRMAGAIAHHFNNQLQVVMGNLQIAMGSLPQGAAPVESMTEAMKAAHRAARVSGQMLTYLGQTPGKRATLDLSEVCRQSLPMVQAGMPRNVALETDLPSEGPAVRANQNQMEQVLTHLMANAWEAMTESGGSICIAVEAVSGENIPPGRRFPVDWQPKPGAYACLEVRDDGPGIPEQDMEKLFDPFFSTKFTGRGLGLSVVLGIVRAHGGCITVESRCRAGSREQGLRPGGAYAPEGTGEGEGGGRRPEDRGRISDVRSQNKALLGDLIYPVAPEDGTGASLRENSVGSIFRVFLPLAAEAVARPVRAAARVPEMKGGGTVLLIEDTDQVRQLGVRMLEHLGCRVIAAKDGVEGVAIFRDRSDEIDWVLSDLTMPRMDGWKTIVALRQIRPDIPVILASGYDEASVMSGDHAERPQVFLGKPYSLEDLRAAISRVQETMESEE